MHKLQTFKTTLKDTGSKIATGQCSCGWKEESTFVKEIVFYHKKHKEEMKKQEAKKSIQTS